MNNINIYTIFRMIVFNVFTMDDVAASKKTYTWNRRMGRFSPAWEEESPANLELVIFRPGPLKHGLFQPGEPLGPCSSL